MENGKEILEVCIEFTQNIIRYCKVLEEEGHNATAYDLIQSGNAIENYLTKAQYDNVEYELEKVLIIIVKEAERIEYFINDSEKSIDIPSLEKLITSLIKIQNMLFSLLSMINKINNLQLNLN